MRHPTDTGRVLIPPLTTLPRQGDRSLLREKGLEFVPFPIEIQRYYSGPYLVLAKLQNRGHSLHPVSPSLLIPTASSEGSKTTFMFHNPLDQTNGNTPSYTLLQGKNTSQNQPREDAYGQSQGKKRGVSNIPFPCGVRMHYPPAINMWQ